ncbi:D-lactate dehydrogenase [Fontimonas thermophila]|uniref:D-lactate dehydrogenase n=1 Tax=Fontimonas thermophila TaxID=1076937 RepID=A0A1I2ICK4_9GAMM|nr:FAD-linked oxidase C-terminal domain-containing protein [Fontimonas thermophila]SFF38261.1 D-lactate dehydrogenase [Fontimonas thermophila]
MSVHTPQIQASPPLPEPVLRRLRDVFPPGRLYTDPADRLAYGYDNSKRMAMPQAVVLAQSHEDVVAVVAICNEFSVPLVVRGRGTNTTGATVPIHGGVVLSLERMNRILRVMPGDRLLECEAGVLNGDVQAEAAKYGLFWAPDPTSLAYSTVGGNLGCCAGGPRAVKYGTARDNVLGLRAVTGAGDSIKTGCTTTKGVVGYDLTRLLVGSEGTLAIITEATLKLLPRPQQVKTVRACYADVKSAAEAVARVMNQPQTPSALEFMDGDAVRLAEDYQPTGIPLGTGALLLMEVDGSDASVDAALQAVCAAASGPGLIELRTAANAAETEALWACRKALSPSLRKIAPKKVNEDVCVPVTRIPELVEGLAALSRRHGIRIVNFGHAGNGNLHTNLLADPDDPAQMQAVQACLGDVFRLVLALEGTLSGEHGVGIEKRDYVGWEIAEATLGVMRAIKRTLDPRGILNPGKALPGI